MGDDWFTQEHKAFAFGRRDAEAVLVMQAGELMRLGCLEDYFAEITAETRESPDARGREFMLPHLVGVCGIQRDVAWLVTQYWTDHVERERRKERARLVTAKLHCIAQQITPYASHALRMVYGSKRWSYAQEPHIENLGLKFDKKFVEIRIHCVDGTRPDITILVWNVNKFHPTASADNWATTQLAGFVERADGVYWLEGELRR